MSLDAGLDTRPTTERETKSMTNFAGYDVPIGERRNTYNQMRSNDLLASIEKAHQFYYSSTMEDVPGESMVEKVNRLHSFSMGNVILQDVEPDVAAHLKETWGENLRMLSFSCAHMDIDRLRLAAALPEHERESNGFFVATYNQIHPMLRKLNGISEKVACGEQDGGCLLENMQKVRAQFKSESKELKDKLTKFRDDHKLTAHVSTRDDEVGKDDDDNDQTHRYNTRFTRTTLHTIDEEDDTCDTTRRSSRIRAQGDGATPATTSNQWIDFFSVEVMPARSTLGQLEELSVLRGTDDGNNLEMAYMWNTFLTIERSTVRSCRHHMTRYSKNVAAPCPSYITNREPAAKLDLRSVALVWNIVDPDKVHGGTRLTNIQLTAALEIAFLDAPPDRSVFELDLETWDSLHIVHVLPSHYVYVEGTYFMPDANMIYMTYYLPDPSAAHDLEPDDSVSNFDGQRAFAYALKQHDKELLEDYVSVSNMEYFLNSSFKEVVAAFSGFRVRVKPVFEGGRDDGDWEWISDTEDKAKAIGALYFSLICKKSVQSEDEEDQIEDTCEVEAEEQVQEEVQVDGGDGESSDGYKTESEESESDNASDGESEDGSDASDYASDDSASESVCSLPRKRNRSRRE